MSLQEGIKYNETVTMATIVCCECGVSFAVTSTFRNILMQDSSKWFCCPNGHKQHYTTSEADRLKRQLDAQKIEHERQTRILQNDLLIERKNNEELSKKVKRIHKGVCPCCNRTFTNLKRHIATKHPEIIKK